MSDYGVFVQRGPALLNDYGHGNRWHVCHTHLAYGGGIVWVAYAPYERLPRGMFGTWRLAFDFAMRGAAS